MHEIMVSIVCLTYNQGFFIKDAIESFLKQKTKFPIEIIVHDDASTDGTTEIIKEYVKKYPEIIVPIFQKDNQYNICRIFPKYVLPKVRGKYIALCDGDDYWTDSMKLQLQVEFMEKHNECTLTMHNATSVRYDNGEKKVLNTFTESGFYNQREQVISGLGSVFPACASMLFRSEIMKQIPDFFLKPKAIDYSLRQYCAIKGKVYYDKRNMSVYRVATPKSFMKMTNENTEFYAEYTIEMIEFFNRFNEYTNFSFKDIMEQKIISDYLGYCCVIEREIGIAKQKGMDIDTLKKCYEYISPINISKNIIKLYKKCKQVYIYGTGRLALVCSKQMEEHNMEICGYVVSDSQFKNDLFNGKKIYYLSELREKISAGFILGVQPINTQSVITELERQNLLNYCEFYSLQNERGENNENM
ncbi:MAG: glycosyltransferase [Lachnospiraceae bacterium]